MINPNLETRRWCLPVGSAGTPRRRLRVGFAAVGVSLAALLAPAASAEAHGGVYSDAHPPRASSSAPWSGPVQISEGHLSMTFSHGWARIRVLAQRRVCGFWGCSYQTKAERSYTMNFSKRHSGHILVAQPCVRGTHTYRTRTIVEVREPTYMYNQGSISPVRTRWCP